MMDGDGGFVDWPPPHTGPATGPLRGIRVLDLSAFAVGPWAAMLLATMGADVVKIDPPYGDPIRNVRPTKHGEPTTYSVCNFGKRNVVLDLKTDEGKGIALELAAAADVVVENSRPGAMSRLGLDFTAISHVNPMVVYCSSSSFGESGPMAMTGSTDPQGQAFSGFVSLNGDVGSGGEFLRHSAVIDLSTSVYLAQSCLVGLHWRERNGRGCHITTSQFEAAMSVQITRSAEFLVAGKVPSPMGAGSAMFAPSGAFRGRDDRYLAVSCCTTRQWRALCRVVGRPDLPDDPRFKTNSDRVANRVALDHELSKVFETNDIAWWRYQLRQANLPVADFAILDDVVSADSSGAPVARHIEAVPHPEGGTIKAGSPPWHFSRTPVGLRMPAEPGSNQDEMIKPRDRSKEYSGQGS